MRPFDYHRSEDRGDAVKTAAQEGALFIAGGTNLLDLMKLDLMTPSQLIDINRIGLDEITETDDGGLSIGALVTNSDCAADPRIRKDHEVLSRAILAGASGQLRNKATTGGNLCQRTRCYYFYDPDMPCNKRKPGSGCSAIGGANRIHAILGASDACIATYPGDMAVAMAALDAQVVIEGQGGATRTVPVRDFHRLPGDQPDKDNILEPGELKCPPHLSQGPRPGVLRFRAGIGGSCRLDGRRQDRHRLARLWRPRPQAVARPED